MDTNRRKIVRRLRQEGWEDAGGTKHDIFRHPDRPGRVVVPRHRELSTGVARNIAEIAGWDEDDQL
ncbi:MAG: type II toxin-antitoxin system HicA family toxin [Hyphomicrobiaceae bacterium]